MLIGCDCSRRLVRHGVELNSVVGSCVMLLLTFHAGIHLLSSVVGSCIIIFILFLMLAYSCSVIVYRDSSCCL